MIDKEELRIMEQNLPLEEHKKAMAELRAKRAEVKENRGHKRLRSIKGKRQRGVTMDNRTYHILGLIRDIKDYSNNGSVLDKLFSSNATVRKNTLEFLTDFVEKLQNNFVYCAETECFEFVLNGDPNEFNDLDKHGYIV